MAFEKLKMNRGVWIFLTVGWGSLIFCLSAIPSLNTGWGVYDLILRKIAHVVVFAVFSFFLHNAIFTSLPTQSRSNILLMGVAGGVLYAISDEVHQAFVPGRGPSALDVFIDSIGVVLGSRIFLRFQKKDGPAHA